MKTKLIPVLTLGLIIQACSPESTMKVNVFETSASGKNLEQVSAFEKTDKPFFYFGKYRGQASRNYWFRGCFYRIFGLQLEPAKSRKSHGGTASLFF